MKLQVQLLLLFGILLTFAACSTSETLDGVGLDEVPPAGDAATDAVPAENPEAALPPAEMAPPPSELAQMTPPPAEPPAQDPVMAPPLAMDSPAMETPPTAPPATDPFAAPPSEPVASVPAASTPASEAYTVQGGDTLMKIAFETYGDLYKWKEIYDWNRDQIRDPNSLASGMKLKLERPQGSVAIERNGDKYLIRRGDTLGKISDGIYGTPTKWRKLWDNNKQLIKDPNRIFAGFYLYYMMSPEERQESDRLKQERRIGPAPVAESGPAEPAPGVDRGLSMTAPGMSGQ